HAFGPLPLRRVAPPGHTRSPPDRVPGPRGTVFAPHHPGHLVRPTHHQRGPTPQPQTPGTAHRQPARPSPPPPPPPRPPPPAATSPSPHLTTLAPPCAPPTSHGRPPPNITAR